MKAEVYLHLEESQIIPSGKSSRLQEKFSKFSFKNAKTLLQVNFPKLIIVAVFEDWTNGKKV